jgi:pyrroloquinoline-quinone synthase
MLGRVQWGITNRAICEQIPRLKRERRVSTTIWDRIEESRSRWNVLEHPFYQRWSAGELSREELASYSGQYRHAVAALTAMSSAAATETPDREDLRRHAAEEDAHVELWDGFVDAVDGDPRAEATPETEECVREWTAADGLIPTLARLYAVESGQPEISRVKRAGLIELYGVADCEGTEYFRVHEGRDDDHAAEVRELIEQRARPADADAVVAAAESAFRANWRLLDGV